MKKGQVYEGIVGNIQFPNKAQVTVEGEENIAIVKNAITGQKVRFSVNKVRKGNCEGRLLEVLEASPLETKEDVCQHYGVCGGCLYESLPYEVQLKIKETQVTQLLHSVVPDLKLEGIEGSPVSTGYRNKMEFSFGDERKDGPLALGMHKRGSFYDIVTVNDCRIADADFRAILSETLKYFQQANTPFYHKMRHEGVLRHLLVRKAAKTKEIMVALVTTTEQTLDLTEWKQRLLELSLEGNITGILHILNDSLADVVQSDETILLYGRDYIEEELLGLRFQITPFSFFQTNSLGAEVLYQTVRDYIGETNERVVFDLYSGTGTIAQVLAPVAKKVVGVEIVEEAVEAAKMNAAKNGLDNCYFLAGDVLKVIDQIEEKPDLIVLDPPRDGIHPKALDKIIQYGVERIVYVSCKPTSLVRDLQILQQRGYEVIKAKAVDMFPGTANIETVVLLSHKKPDGHINVKVEFGEGEGKVPLDNIAKRAESYKPKERVTYKMIKEYIEAKYGFKVHTAYIAEVKRDLGLPMYDAPNAVEELKQPRKHPTPEKVEAIKDALKHFEVI
ncbi:MAG: 23S rRNA (uracil(1939)-C(5))-methyltransferase RlmD [Candidatus Fimimorpha sp.]